MQRVSKVYFQCDKCGKEEEYEATSSRRDDVVTKEGCWSIDLGRAGYGSRLDCCDVKFDLCDDCLCEFIETFKYKNRIYND
jgi:hypothetical protein